MLARERPRLALKYGKESAPVAAVDEQVGNHDRLRQDAVYEADLSRQEPPAADRGSYQVYGLVRAAGGAPQPGVTVALYDRQGAAQANFGAGCTNERGYFLLQSQPAKTRQTAASRIVSSAGTEKSQAEIPPVQLYVLGARQEVLYIDPTPLQPRLGEVDFRVIILSEKPVAACAPPPKTVAGKPGAKPKTRKG